MLRTGDKIILPRDVTVDRNGEYLVFKKGTTVWASAHGSVVTKEGVEVFLTEKITTEGINVQGIADYLADRLLEADFDNMTARESMNYTKAYVKAFGIENEEI